MNFGPYKYLKHEKSSSKTLKQYKQVVLSEIVHLVEMRELENTFTLVS